MATTVIRKVSYEEFQELPRDGRKLYELIEGEVFMTPSPNTKHQTAAANLRVYEAGGVSEIWYVDPEEGTVEILNRGLDGRCAVTARLSGNDAIVSKALPELSLTLDEVFAT